MGNRVKWRKFLRSGAAAVTDKGKRRQALGEISRELRFRRAQRSLSLLLVLHGLGLASLALWQGDGWVSRSPLLNLFGAGTVLVLLCITWLAGLGWWCITSSLGVTQWAQDLFPWGIQPHRSALGVAALFALLACLVRWQVQRSRSSRRVVEPLCVVLTVTIALLALMAAWIWLGEVLYE